jgi:two-component system OmpR family response regulator/two-component system response regulator QseB
MAAHILIAANDETLRSFLTRTLLSEGWTTSDVTTGDAVAHRLEQEQFELVLLDLRVPAESGMDLIHLISEISPGTRIIVVSQRRSFEAVLKGLRHHISDFLLIPMVPLKLIISVRKALEQPVREASGRDVGTFSKTGITRVNGITVNFARRTITWPGHQVLLTPSEGRLLGILFQFPGKPISSAEIVQEVQGYSVEPTEAALVLRPLISRLRRKLARVPGGEHWIVNIRGTGYLYERRNA